MCTAKNSVILKELWIEWAREDKEKFLECWHSFVSNPHISTLLVVFTKISNHVTHVLIIHSTFMYAGAQSPHPSDFDS
jgi:hypothetical protein